MLLPMLKKIDQGVSVTSSLFGTDRLYRFAHINPEIKVERVELTHNISLISQFECFVTINSALEVDLTGQVNAESIGKNYIGTIGGQADFVRTALSTQHGRSVVALPSINESSGKSRIVSHLNGPTTTLRADADAIATEWGIAELRGKTIKQRVHAMINTVHPDQRENLDRQAHELTAGF